MSGKIIILGVAGVVIFIVGISFLLTTGQKKDPEALTYKATEQDRPRVETSNTFADLGEIKVSDVKQKDFTFKNAGTKPLQILNVNSSCNCTTGQIIYKDLTSKEFGMHNQSGFVTDIAPGGTAILRLIYRPAVMPIYGLVEREVYVTTNDPEKQRLVFSMKAIVK